jgi:hypothetical protein
MPWEDTFIFPFVGHERVAWMHFNGGKKCFGEKNLKPAHGEQSLLQKNVV